MTTPITPPENTVGGQIWSWTKIDCGPTFGLIRRPLFNDKYLDSGTTYTLQPYDCRLLIKLGAPATFTITLLPVLTWLRQPWGLFPVQIKDVGLTAAVGTPIVVVRGGADTIDGLTQVSIISAGGSLSVSPKTDLTGWELRP